MYHNLLEKNMFPVDFPVYKVCILYELREWDIYLFKRAENTVIEMPKGIH